MLEDYVLFLAEIDNENEASGRKQQIEWEEEIERCRKIQRMAEEIFKNCE